MLQNSICSEDTVFCTRKQGYIRTCLPTKTNFISGEFFLRRVIKL